MGKTAVIICAGDFPQKEYPKYLISTADYIICCDGAFQTWLKKAPSIFGDLRLPNAIVGDMDSLSPSIQKKYSSIIVRIAEQDTNDQTKAFKYIMENYKDVEYIHILGASGKREDHTIGNLSLLMEYCRMPIRDNLQIDIVSDYSTAFAITDSCELHIGEGRTISIFSPDNSLNIESEGLVWPTDSVVFDNWWKATLNKTSSDIVKLTFSHKSIALIILN
ncbi:MAG: thiamine diphosphokinase [Candidatus Cryptobacteroides sp.]